MLWSHRRGIRPHFSWKGDSPCVSRVAVRSVGSLELRSEVWVPSSCHRELREPFILLLGSQESVRVVKGLSGFLSSWCRGLGPHLELRWETRGSPRVVMGILGSSQIVMGISRNCSGCLGESGLLPSCEGNLGFLSSRFREIGSHLKLMQETRGSSSVATGILAFLLSSNRGSGLVSC